MPRPRPTAEASLLRRAAVTPAEGDGAGDAPATARAERADARRNRARVFAAAQACFAERGAEASMEDIAHRAGVGIGTLYRAFGRRAQLAEAVFCDLADALAEEATRLARADDPWEALAAWLAAYTGLLRSKRAMWGALRPLFQHHPALLLESRQRAVAVVDALLRPLQTAGVVRPDLHAADLLQLVNGAAGSAAADPERAEVLLSIVLDGIRTHPGPQRAGPKPVAPP